jgi:tetratricopeptide (TPR) repeat protein
LGDATAEARLTATFAMAELFAGKVEQGLRRIEGAAKTAGLSGDRELSVRLDGRVAYMYILSGRVREALDVMDRVIAEQRAGVSVEVGSTEWFGAFRALPLAYMGRLDEATKTLETVLARARERSDPASTGTMAGIAVTIAWFRGDANAALSYAQEQVRIAERLQTPTLLAGAYDSMGVACFMSERYHDALEYSERSLRIARESGTLLQSEAVFVTNLAAACVGTGDLGRGIALARDAVAIARERHTPLFECRALLVCLRALLAGGAEHADEAATTLADALAIVERTGAAGYEPFLRVEASRLARLRGDAASGASELATASRQFRQMGANGHAERLGIEPSLPAA